MASTLDQLVVELRADISGLKTQLSSATAQINNFTNQADRSGKKFTATTVAMGVGFERAVAAITAGSIQMVKSVFDTGIQMQALQNKMTASIGSSYAAADALLFVSDQSQKLGLDFQSSANSFANFSASALRSGLTLDQTQKIFTSVAEAATALHLSADQTSSAFLALEQMASKGTVQMQELKLQLAQALPGAFEIMAKAMGVTTQQLNVMMQKGQVLASDVLPKLGDELHAEFGERAVQASNSAQASINRLHNAIFNLKADMASNGVLDAFTTSINEMTEALNNPGVQRGFMAIAGGLAEIIKLAAGAAAFIGALTDKLRGVQGALSGPMDKGGSSLASSGSSLFSDLQKNNVVKGQPGALASNDGKLKSQLESLKHELASETEQLQLEYDKRQKLLEEALKKGEVTKQQYRDLSFKNELKYKNDYADLYTQQEQDRLEKEQQVADAVNAIRRGTLDSSIGLLQTLGQKNKAFAIAAIALEKAKGIAEVLIASRVAAAKALAIYGPTPQGFAAAAEATTFGYIQAGLIAATGLAEIASTSGGGNGATAGSSDNFSDGASTTVNGVAATQAPQPKVLNIHVSGDADWTPSRVRDLLNSINTFIGDGSVRINGLAA